jgi:broad specificity phosphatase PhoE
MPRLLALILLALAACSKAPPPTAPTASPAAHAASAVVAPAPAPAMVFLVRHAEKALDQGEDPDLTPDGQARAEALATALAHAGVTHLYATEYRRTQRTLEPLATRLGLTVGVVPAKDSAAQLARLRELPPGAVVVVAGHSNTIPGLVRGLGARAQDLTDADYDRLFAVALTRTATGTRATAAELRYGAPSKLPL